jgi:hypothetical protein
MKYQDVIQFDPISTVIQIRSADELESARQLVRSYVFSDTMADRLTHVVLPKLNFVTPNDSKGLLVVGNYGTGKSHFMSVISAICEHELLVHDVSHPAIAQHPALTEVAGKFKVIRTEIGAVQTSLKDIIFTTLTENLARMNVTFTIPDGPQVNNKIILEEMMSAFNTVYPFHGLLIVIDELLDYLRSRPDQALILDLGFLRELGEVCATTRIRFIAGVQEAIFDSSRFEHVADMLRRVRDRFDQILIVRSDIKYVVSERLLKKSDAQKDMIRAHLSSFTRYFPNMLNRLDEFVQLFPIHPDYFGVFDDLRIIEKREVLKTLSELMQRNLERDVPSDQPGLFSYETYWANIKENPVLRADENIRTVIERSGTINDRIQTLPAPKRPYASKIIQAISIQRLSTPTISDPIGVTSAELRDSLTLFNPNIAQMGGSAPEDDLRTYIDSLLKDISNVMNNQFLTHNTANGQWYLDLNKTEDFEANIARRAETIDTNAIDRSYFAALKQILELTEQQTHVTGYNIWQYELEWVERRAMRWGYLFFGAPNERSTAVPIREFYVYFVQPYAPPRYSDEKLTDEVFIKLTRRDAEIDEALKLAAAANDLMSNASGQSKAVYTGKAREYNQRVFHWLTSSMLRAFEVTHQGRTQLLESWFREQAKNQTITQQGQLNFRDVIRAVSSYCLHNHFVQKAPEYPKFSVIMSSRNRSQAAIEALRAIAGQNRTQLAHAILDALQLLHNERIEVTHSPYAQYILDILNTKGDGQVVNQHEILNTQNTITYMAPDRMRLEPEFTVVVLAALIYTGYVELDVQSTKYDATKLSQLASAPIEQLINFRHIKRPQDYNIPVLQSLMKLLELPPAFAQNIAQGNDTAVVQVQTRVSELVQLSIQLGMTVRNGTSFWGRDLLSELGFTSIGAQLTALKDFLERLPPYNTPARFKTFPFSANDIEQHASTIATMQAIRRVLELTNALVQTVSWLTTADGNIPNDDPWHARYIATRDATVDRITAQSDKNDALSSITVQLNQLKADYSARYSELHNKQRASGQQAQRKKALLEDQRYAQLTALANIDILPRQQLLEFQTTVTAIRECTFLSPADLEHSPLCPQCQFRPTVEPSLGILSHKLDQLDQQLDALVVGWQQTLLDHLNDPVCHDSIPLLTADAQALINRFMGSRALPTNDLKGFANAVNEVCRGFVPKNITVRELYRKLRLADGAVAPEELKRRFLAYIDELALGHPPDRIRIIVDESSSEDA